MMDALYQRWGHGYRRAAFIHQDGTDAEHEGRAERLLPHIIGGDILIVGCGLGLLNEALARRLPTANIYGIDNGPYLADLPPGEITGMPFLQLDLYDDNADAFRAAGWPTEYDTVIGDDLAATYDTDAEIDRYVKAVAAYAKPGGAIVHYSVVGAPDPSRVVNSQELEYWKARAGTHVWVGIDGRTL